MNAMPGREEVPEEALEFCNKEREVRLVEAAAPAIRDQERQRIREALLSAPAVEAAKDAFKGGPRPGSYLQNHHVRKALNVALATLEADHG